MSRASIVSMTFALLLGGAVSGARAQEGARPDVADAVVRLASSVDRLVNLLEKDAQRLMEDREARRVEVVVGILGIRYRKIAELESEIRGIESEDDQLRDAISMMRLEIEAVERESRLAEGEPDPERARERVRLEGHIKLQEGRSAKLAERRQLAQNELLAERRRIANLEGILDSWAETLR